MEPTLKNTPQNHPLWLRRLDKYFLVMVFGMGVFFTLNLHKGKRLRYVIWSDAEGYYLYLPGLFIYDGDFTQSAMGEDGFKAVNCCAHLPDGQVVTRYTSGVAIMQAPFFGVAHAITSLFYGKGTAPPDFSEEKSTDPTQKMILDRQWSSERGYATGFSLPYARSILFASLFYLGLGLWFVKEVLKRHFSLPVALIAVWAIFLGTNLFAYGLREAGMSHVYSFALFGAFLYVLPGFLRNPKWGNAIVLGLILGLAVLIRPTNIFLGFLVLGWEVYSWKAFRERIGSLLSSWKYIIAAGIASFLVFVPQMLYWKSMFGTWLAWSYEKEGFFNWKNFKFLHVLFHYQNGLFLYTPLMLFAVWGMFVGIRKRKMSSPVILITFLVITFVFSSWWAWWFGGAFGHRCYVEWYGLLALPLALIIERWSQFNQKWMRILGALLLAGLCFANIKMTYLYDPPWDGDNWTFSSYLDVWKRVIYFWRFWP